MSFHFILWTWQFITLTNLFNIFEVEGVKGIITLEVLRFVVWGDVDFNLFKIFEILFKECVQLSGIFNE